MIDVHCHLEQGDYEPDREAVIENCRAAGLKAVITCCANPKDLELTLSLVQKYKNFIFACASWHPEHIKEINDEDLEAYLEKLRANKDLLVGIGETGLDFIIEEERWREKQKELFIKFIRLAEELDKPLIIHARGAFAETIEVLEKNRAKNVLMHFFSARELLDKVIKNGWFISMNTTVLKSKKMRKIARDVPLENLMLETDAPWLAPADHPDWPAEKGKRNDPTAIKITAQKIAEIKKMHVEGVIEATTKNVVKFFSLPI